MLLIYNSRNYLGIIAHQQGQCRHNQIYNSRNYLGIIATGRHPRRRDHIYNSRNYLGIIAVSVARIFEILSTIVEIT